MSKRLRDRFDRRGGPGKAPADGPVKPSRDAELTTISRDQPRLWEPGRNFGTPIMWRKAAVL